MCMYQLALAIYLSLTLMLFVMRWALMLLSEIVPTNPRSRVAITNLSCEIEVWVLTCFRQTPPHLPRKVPRQPMAAETVRRPMVEHRADHRFRFIPGIIASPVAHVASTEMLTAPRSDTCTGLWGSIQSTAHGNADGVEGASVPVRTV